MASPALLIYNPDSQKWEHFLLTRQKVSIGRAPDNDLVVDDPLVSRQHASLHLDQRGVWVIDLNTPNGVMVNNARIQPGQWVLLSDGATLTIGPSTMRLELAPQKMPAPQPVRPASNPGRKTGWKIGWLSLAALGAFLCVCVVAGMGVAAWMNYPKLVSLVPGLPAVSQKPAAAPTAVPFSPPETVETLPVTPGGPAVMDSHGVGLEIPASALAAGQPASLESASFSQGMQQELEKAYQIESLAYSVTAANQDGSGQAILSLPAPSPEARLAVLLDNQYAGVLDIEPQNGVLQVNPFLGAPLTESSAPTETLFIASNRYFVVTPKTSASYRPEGDRLRVSYPVQADDPDGKSCITEFWLQSHCWRNPESTVYVFWESNVPAELKDTEYLRVIDMIKAVAEIMRAYNQNHHFSNAAISKSNPVYVIIDPSETEPTYSQKTGNIYLNWGVVGTITSQENHCALAHELMHWTEDSAYAMNAAALSNSKAWWLEMAAENGSFLIDAGCIDRNLAQYGKAVTNDNLLPLQSESLVWNRKEGARYIQALQVYISLCEGGANCAMSQEQFVAAINGGTYPFDDAGVLAAYQRSAKDMGLFLLGRAPAEARASAHIIPDTRVDGAFAEFIWMKAVPAYKIDISDNGKQIRSSSSGEASVTAAIAQGGEYPLWVSNGKGMPGNTREGYTSLPGLLQIDAGTKFWYALDSGDPVFHDGGKELTLGPISDKMGTGLVRLVAVAPEAQATLSAKVKPVDLSGDWMAQLSSPVVNPINCPSSNDNDGNGFDTNGASQLEMLAIFSMYGTYATDASVSDGSHLIWDGSLPEGVTGESDITIKPDKIEVKYHIDIPKPESSGLLAPWLGPKTGLRLPPAGQGGVLPAAILAAGALLLGLVLQVGAPGIKAGLEQRLAWRAGSKALLALGLLAGTFWLSGCFGLSIWGTIDGTITFAKLEYIDPNAPAAQAAPEGEAMTGLTWKLHNGLEENTMDLFVEVTTSNADGVETSETQECKFSVKSAAEGFIGPADMVKIPETNN